MILSDRDLRDRIIQDHREARQAKEWWKRGEWDTIGNRILIEPFENDVLGPCCYDLSVGEEYISLREPKHVKKLHEGESFNIGPGETVLILTKEYICLPKDVLAMIVPRARWIFEGTVTCTTRIDPTWYGKLIIGFTNLAKNPVALDYGEGFCTCYFMEASETETVLTRDKVYFLGRSKIGRLNFQHVIPQDLLQADRVDQTHIEKVVDMYGWPWDVVRGMFLLNKRLLEDYIDRDRLPELSEKVITKTTYEARKEIDKITNRMFYTLVGLFTVLAGLFGWLIYLLSAFLSSPP